MKQSSNKHYSKLTNLPGVEDGIRSLPFDDPQVVAAEMHEAQIEDREDAAKPFEYQPATAELGSLGIAAAVAAEQARQNSQRHRP
jgi:hypothetical protein